MQTTTPDATRRYYLLNTPTKEDSEHARRAMRGRTWKPITGYILSELLQLPILKKELTIRSRRRRGGRALDPTHMLRRHTHHSTQKGPMLSSQKKIVKSRPKRPLVRDRVHLSAQPAINVGPHAPHLYMNKNRLGPENQLPHHE
jgi:hypothetical protein